MERYRTATPASTASSFRLPAGVVETAQPAAGHNALRDFAVANLDFLVEIDAIEVVPD